MLKTEVKNDKNGCRLVFFILGDSQRSGSSVIEFWHKTLVYLLRDELQPSHIYTHGSTELKSV